MGGDSLYGIPGVLLYVPKAGRGTATNYLGYFSMPLVGGDSVVVRALGFKEKYFIVPSDTNKVSYVIQLAEDTTVLAEIEVFPWPTEQLFKEAFLALRLPEEEMNNMHKNLNEQVMKRMMYTLQPDGKMNHNYYMKQQVSRIENPYNAPSLTFLNPFAWSNFIGQVKKGGLRNKQWEEADKYKDE